MDWLLNISLLIFGFLLLIKGASWLVDGGSSMARCLGISDLFIGLTVISLGTSMPEFFIDTTAAAGGNTGLVIGSIIGSNVANILLILGIGALIFPLVFRHNTTWKEIPFTFLAAAMVFILGNDGLVDGAQDSFLGRIDGLVLVSFFVIYIYYLADIAKNESRRQAQSCPRGSMRASLLRVVFGLIGLFLGAQAVVNTAVFIAGRLNVSQNLIGLAVVSIGSTLPELTATVVAAMKKRPELALGNIVGSNIANIFLVLGLCAIIRPLPLRPQDNFAIGIAILASLLLFLSAFVGRRHTLDRWTGGLFVSIYVFYLISVLRMG